MEDMVVNGLDVKPINYIAEKVCLSENVKQSRKEKKIIKKSFLLTDIWPWIQLCETCLCPRHHLYGSCYQGWPLQRAILYKDYNLHDFRH